MSDHYTFLFWVRDDAAAQISQTETLSTTLPSRALIDVDLDLLSIRQTAALPVNVKPALYGPGDVKSLDRDEIVRVDPQPNSNGFEPNYFDRRSPYRLSLSGNAGKQLRSVR